MFEVFEVTVYEILCELWAIDTKWRQSHVLCIALGYYARCPICGQLLIAARQLWFQVVPELYKWVWPIHLGKPLYHRSVTADLGESSWHLALNQWSYMYSYYSC